MKMGFVKLSRYGSPLGGNKGGVEMIIIAAFFVWLIWAGIECLIDRR